MNVFHHEIGNLDARALTHVGDLRDVGVRQPRHQARLVEEHPQQLRIESVLRQQPLDRDDFAEVSGARGDRQINLGHAPHREPLGQLIPPEALPGREQWL